MRYLLLLILAILINGCSDFKETIQVTPVPTLATGDDYLDPNIVAELPQVIAIPTTLPEAYDMSGDFVPVGNQGGLGSCVAWATGYYARSYIAHRNFKWEYSIDHIASPLWLYGKTINYMGKDYGQGTSILSAMDILVRYGCNSIAYTPYTDALTPPDLTDKDSYIFRINSYKSINCKDREAIKYELSKNNPVIFSLTLHDDFFGYYTGVYNGDGPYNYPNNSFAASRHALCLVGYDNSKGYKLVNSWDTSWGENGYGWISFNAFEKDCNLAAVIEEWSNVVPTEPPPITTPDIQIKDSYQFTDWFYLITKKVYMYIEFECNQPLLIQSITLAGHNIYATQKYNIWASDGYIYFYREDGDGFEPGTYSVVFKGIDSNNQEFNISRDTYIGKVPAGNKLIKGQSIKPQRVNYNNNDIIIYGMNHKECTK